VNEKSEISDARGKWQGYMDHPVPILIMIRCPVLVSAGCEYERYVFSSDFPSETCLVGHTCLGTGGGSCRSSLFDLNDRREKLTNRNGGYVWIRSISAWSNESEGVAT
jgi:hypothetical protein